MGAIVCENGLGYVEPGNNMVKNELSCHLTIYKICKHHFSPFGEIIHNDDNIVFPPGRARVTCDIIDVPSGKGANGNDMVSVSEWGAHIVLVNLAFVALTHNKNAVCEDG